MANMTTSLLPNSSSTVLFTGERSLLRPHAIDIFIRSRPSGYSGSLSELPCSDKEHAGLKTSSQDLRRHGSTQPVRRHSLVSGSTRSCFGRF